MPKLKTKIVNTIQAIIAKLIGGLSQEEGDGQMGGTPFEGMPALALEAASEGAVLLKNEGVLPLAKEDILSVYGRVQTDYFFVGYGSGGDVRAPYRTGLLEALQKDNDLAINQTLANTYKTHAEQNPIDHGFWAHWPMHYPEMPLSDAAVAEHAKHAATALVAIGRSSGEDRESLLKEGSYYLTKDETNLLTLATKHYQKVVVLLNIGSVMDLSWVNEFEGKIGAVLLVYQGGMESGPAICDLLSGRVCPSGRLTDTVAKRHQDYPSSATFGAKKFNEYREDIFVGYRYFETFAKEQVLFPFGYGLSYTTFESTVTLVKEERQNEFVFEVLVTNTGERAGKEATAIYLKAPQGKLGKAERVLAAFAKTKTLAAGESETLTLRVSLADFASYDDAGKAMHKSCFVLEGGEYQFYLGADVRLAKLCHVHHLTELLVVRHCNEAVAAETPFPRLTASLGADGNVVMGQESVPTRTVSLKERIKRNIPSVIPFTGDKGLKLADVKTGTATMEQFVAQLTPDELEALSRGDYTMNSPLGTPGNASVYGGVLDSLQQKGIRPVTTTDGPSGIRLYTSCSLLPIGVLLASTWNTELVTRLYQKTGEEMKAKGSDVLLAPGMNIHRNPLCGRNFEYFSEDPFLSGKMGAATVAGIQAAGASACPKHFACNNQETNRNKTDSRLSERALREIYLRGFEICVKGAAPHHIMTSYNKINGVWGHYHYELCTTILRGEWGYQGAVMTDWWMRPSKSPEFPSLKNNAYRVRAGVDMLMPGGKRAGKKKPDGTLLATLGKPDGITLGELQQVAIHVLNSIQ